MKRKALKGSPGNKYASRGLRTIMLGVTPQELEKIKAAAALEMRPVTQFVLYYALKAAATVNPNQDAAKPT